MLIIQSQYQSYIHNVMLFIVLMFEMNGFIGAEKYIMFSLKHVFELLFY